MSSNGKLTGIERMMRKATGKSMSRRGMIKTAAATAGAFTVLQGSRYGLSQDVVGAVYIGFDQPRSLGGYVQGGTFAAPIFKQFVQETRNRWSHKPFVAPP